MPSFARSISAFFVIASCSSLWAAGEDLMASGVRLAQQERYAEAANVFRRCVREAPNSFEAHYNLALALLALGSFAESRQAMEGVRPQGSSESGARDYILGKIDAAVGNRKRAEQELSAALRASPSEENRAIDYGMILLGEGDYQAAIGTFSHASELHPESAYVQLGLAIAQAFGGQTADAEVGCRRMLAVNPSFAPAVLVMAFAQYMSGAYDAAARTADNGLQLPSPAPYLYYVHAAALQRMNSTSYGRILADLEAAEKSIPSCTLCYFVSSKVHESAGDVPSAIADLNTLVTLIAPDFDQAWYRLGVLYRKQGRAADASLAFARYKASRAASTNLEVELARDFLLPQPQR